MYIHYPALIMLVGLHTAALCCLPYLYFFGASTAELTYHGAAYLLGGLGITVLYHRCWAHGAAKLAPSIEYLFAVLSIFVLQMPARQWISSHIKHHDHTDHDDDPYNIQKGFWWAHFEWIIFAPVPPIELPKRLASNKVIFWQERWYWPIFGFINIALPVGISVSMGYPWWGGLLLTCLRLVLTMNVVFAVNSVCHFWGTRPFTLDVSAKNVWWFPLALGEQYHNYHHAFPRDYRHGIETFDFDPTKWIIKSLAVFGLASNLFEMPAARVQEAMADVSGKKSGSAQLPSSGSTVAQTVERV